MSTPDHQRREASLEAGSAAQVAPATEPSAQPCPRRSTASESSLTPSPYHRFSDPNIMDRSRHAPSSPTQRSERRLFRWPLRCELSPCQGGLGPQLRMMVTPLSSSAEVASVSVPGAGISSRRATAAPNAVGSGSSVRAEAVAPGACERVRCGGPERSAAWPCSAYQLDTGTPHPPGRPPPTPQSVRVRLRARLSARRLSRHPRPRHRSRSPTDRRPRAARLPTPAR